ncbi:MAG: hypothetical protein PHR56_07830 [Dehalococcoidales bacterium]|nr:hypothetical protein [Dehalococcoidales bacterium]
MPQALDQMATKPVELKKFEWGCMAGEHTGYAFVNAASETEAKSILPEPLRNKARAIGLNKFTMKDIKEAHQP